MGEVVPALDDGAARERVARVDGLLEEIEGAIGAVPVDTALELVQALLDLYGEGLARIVGHVAASPEAAEALARAFADDELVSHLLLLHGLHPEALESRVERALEGVRPYLRSHGGDVELIGVENGVARVRLHGSCHGCPASSLTLRMQVEDALRAAAPELACIEADGDAAAVPAPSGLVALERVRDKAHQSAAHAALAPESA
jgi:Fe-S cluster biogenesis protein NfuA